jgi:DNA polymerase-3 subunit delta
MKLTLENLAGHLKGRLAPVYLLSGEEALLLGEASDAIRAAARAAGFSEREVHFADRGVDWSGIRAAVGTLSLFGDRRVLEIRLGASKPGKEGGATLAALAEAAGSDTLLLVLAGRLDRDAQTSAWFKALEQRGAWLPVWEIDAGRLPQWLAQRCRRVGLEPTPEALSLLADRVEGNLLAAQQEIEKLALLVPPGRLDVVAVLDAVADSARYDVFALGEAVLAGDAERALRLVEGLRGEGVEPTLVLWSLVRELRNLWEVRHGAGGGGRGGPRMSPSHAAALDSAGRRAARFPFARLSARALRADRMIKGRLEGSPWDEILLLSAEFCGLRAPAAPLQRRGV